MLFIKNCWVALAIIVSGVASLFSRVVVRECAVFFGTVLLIDCACFLNACFCICLMWAANWILTWGPDWWCMAGVTAECLFMYTSLIFVGVAWFCGVHQSYALALVPLTHRLARALAICDFVGLPALRGVNVAPSMMAANFAATYVSTNWVVLPTCTWFLTFIWNNRTVPGCGERVYQSGSEDDVASFDCLDGLLVDPEEIVDAMALPDEHTVATYASMSTLPFQSDWLAINYTEVWYLVAVRAKALGRLQWALENAAHTQRRWVDILYFAESERGYFVHASALGRDPNGYYMRVDTHGMTQFRPRLGVSLDDLDGPLQLRHEVTWDLLTVDVRFLNGPLAYLYDSIIKEVEFGPVSRLEAYIVSGQCREDIRTRDADERKALFNRAYTLPRPHTKAVTRAVWRLAMSLLLPGHTVRRTDELSTRAYQSGPASDDWDELMNYHLVEPQELTMMAQLEAMVRDEVPSVAEPSDAVVTLALFMPIERTGDPYDPSGYGHRCYLSRQNGFGDFVDEVTYDLAWNGFVALLPRIWDESRHGRVLHPSGASDWFRGKHPEEAVALARCVVWYALGLNDTNLANFCRGRGRSLSRKARRTRRTIDEFGASTTVQRDPSKALAAAMKVMEVQREKVAALSDRGYGTEVPLNRQVKVFADFLTPEDRQKMAEYGRISRPIVLYGKVIDGEIPLLSVEGLFKHDKGLFRQLRTFVAAGSPADGHAELDGRIRRAFQKVSHQVSRRDAAAALPEVKYQNGTAAGLDALRELVGEAWDLELGEFRFARFALFAIQMYRVPTILDAVLCTLAYFGDFASVRNIADSALRAIYEEYRMLEVVTADRLYQAGEPHWSSHPLFSQFWGVLASLSLSHLLNQHSASIGAYGMSLLREKALVGAKKGDSVLERLMSFMVEALKLTIECAKTCSLDPLFRGCLDVKGWQLRANAVVTYRQILVVSQGQASDEQFRDLVKRKVVPSHWTEQFSFTAFRDELTTLVAEGEGMLPHIADVSVGSSVNSLLKRVRLLMEECVADVANSAYRIQPLGIMLSGPPGFGKTILMQQTFRSVGNLMGWDVSSVSEYSWQLGVNFQDGLSSTQWGVYMDDVDADVSKPARGSSNHVLDVMNVINNKPFPVEQARVEAKGTVVARPLLVQYATNFADGRLDGYAADAQAFWRRLKLKVEIRPRAEFLGADGSLDQQKIGGVVDIHEIDVYEYDRSLYRESARFAPTYRLVAEGLTNRKYYAWVAAYMKTHLASQRKLLANMVCGPESCPVCGVSIVDGEQCCEYQATGVELVSFAASALFAYWFAQFLMQPALYLRGVNAYFRHMANFMSEGRREYIAGRHLVAASVHVFKWVGLSVAVLQLCQTALLAFLAARWWAQQRQYQMGDNGLTVGSVNYVRLGTEYPVGVPPFRGATFTREEMLEQVRRARVIVTNAFGQTTNGLIVTHNTILVNDHVVDGGVVTVKGPTWSERVVISTLTYRKIGSTDSGLLLVHNLPAGWGALSKLWVSPDTTIAQFDEAILVDAIGERLLVKPLMAQVALRPFGSDAGRLHGGLSVMHNTQTHVGDCGLVYAARVGASWRCVAIHSFFDEKNKRAYGVCVDQQSIRAAALALGTQPAEGEYCVKQMTLRPSLQALSSYRAGTSEVVYANDRIGMGFFPIGRATPPVHGQSMKSKVHPTIFAQSFVDDEVRVCGSKNYWQTPMISAHGRWINDGKDKVWISPFQHAHAAFQRNLDKVDMHLWWLALMDYILPLARLDCSGYRVLSPHESLSGLPEMRTHAANLNTSAGMPFNQPKKAGTFYVTKDREFYVSAPMEEVFGEIEKILLRGEIPIPVTLCVLKDEGVKSAKNEKRDLRVFNIMSAAYNSSCKQRTASVHAFMRAFRDVFECAVGVNMASTDVTALIVRLAQVDPTLLNIIETDMVKQDKSQNGLHCSSVARCMYAMALALGLPRATAFEIWALLEGLRSSVYVEKNDFYQMGGRNPSGSNETVEQNSIDNSVTDRYARLRALHVRLSDEQRCAIDAYVAQFFADPFAIPEIVRSLLDYRENVAAYTYGDDALRAFRERMDMVEYVKAYGETGLVLSDADKSSPLVVYKALAHVSFLKRHFVFNDEIGRYVAPLEEKSIIRMLLLNKGSVLSDRDHDSIALEEAMRELVYHGREKFNTYREKMLKVKEELNLDHCYLQLLTFDEYWQMVKDGNFQTWIDAEMDLTHLVKSVAVSDLVVYQMNSQVKLEPASAGDKGSEDQGCKVAPARGEGNTQTHASGAIEGTGMVDCTDMQQGSVTSKLETLSLQDWPKRNLLLETVALTTSSAAMSSLLDFDPHTVWLTNPYVQGRLGNTFYLRGKLVLDIVTVAQPGCYGLVTVSAKPRGGPTPTNYQEVLTATTVPRQQLKCVPHVDIDLALSGRATLELPWIGPVDWASTSTVQGLYTWSNVAQYIVTVWNWATIGSGDGTVAGANMSIYARLEDAELSTMCYQGKFGAAAGLVASAASALATVPVFAPVASGVAAIAGTAAQIMDFFGFTRTGVEPESAAMKMVSHTGLGPVDVTDASEKVALYSSNAISKNPRVAGGFSDADPTALAYLFSHWTYLDSVTWSGTSTTTTELVTIPVTPFCAVSTGSASTWLELPVAGYVGLPFAQWRGTMEYLIVPLVSKFHRGALQAYWAPTCTGPVTGDITNAVSNVIFNVAPGLRHEFVVGFAGATPSLSSGLLSPATPAAQWGMAYNNGQIGLKVVAPLVASNGIGSNVSVPVLIFCRAGEDMRFGVPRVSISASAVVPYICELGSIQYQSGAVGDEATITVERHSLVAPNAYPAKDLLWGEVFHSVRPLFQKFSRINEGLCTTGGSAVYWALQWAIPHVPRPILYAYNNNLVCTQWSPGVGIFDWAVHYVYMYAGFAGAMRYKLKGLDIDANNPSNVNMVASATPWREAQMQILSLERRDTGLEGFQQVGLKQQASSSVANLER